MIRLTPEKIVNEPHPYTTHMTNGIYSSTVILREFISILYMFLIYDLKIHIIN